MDVYPSALDGAYPEAHFYVWKDKVTTKKPPLPFEFAKFFVELGIVVICNPDGTHRRHS